MKTLTWTEDKYVLALDTATDSLGVALWCPNSDKSFIFNENAFRNQSSSLHPQIVDILSEAGVDITDVGLIVCTNGPGSFTGVRIGLSAGQGLAKALGIDLVGISTLEVVAQAGSTVWIPAIRGEVYLQSFDETCQPLTEATVLPILEAVTLLKQGDSLYVCGHVDMPEDLPEIDISKAVIDPLILAQKGYRKYQQQGVQPVQPIYLSQLRYRKKDAV